ncbi:DHH family phosphoesterase [Nonlabens spongiae]|uniref:DHH family phosphoesterase n=1 Tax=Nonlabens spongiae TaxID=331648 RepID=A0A1W6MGV5_9FLAO|nr:DHH family phosphoesterase [Nonlabens spongiae]ARN76838.1 DHH family phosphoesterase [Nonlabens spongiae]
MNENQVKELKSILTQPKKITVVPHKSPDGDAVGSTTALKGYLDQLGHEVSLVTPNDFPKFLKWLPDADLFINVEQQPEKVEEIINAADLIFCLDHNDLSRTGELEKYLVKSKADFVMIDHHQQPGDFAKYTYSDTSMSSTCQMVFHFLEMMQAIDVITPAMATSMYTGILTDTGSFKFSSTTSTTLRVAAALVDNGANPEMINRRIYDTNTPNRLKLLGTALNNLVVLPEYRAAYITLSQKEQDDHDFKKGDTEGFVNYALSIDDIVFAQIFLENKQEGIIKTSLRSKGTFNVNKMAREHWQGGGHNNAAGGKSDESLEDTVTKLISILPAYEKELLATDI